MGERNKNKLVIIVISLIIIIIGGAVLYVYKHNEYKNALNTAKEIVATKAFSESQVRSELFNYSSGAIDYAIENCGANWNDEAVEMAKEINSELILAPVVLKNELASSKFNDSEIKYAVENAGIDWKYEALQYAHYLVSNNGIYILSDIKDSAVKYGFTASQTDFDKTKIDSILKEEAIKQAQKLAAEDCVSWRSLSLKLGYLGFAEEIAIYASDNAKIDWNAEALEKAKKEIDKQVYTKNTFSSNLLDFGFTSEQAGYAVNNCNDYLNKAILSEKNKALKFAKEYVKNNNVSWKGLVEVLENNNFKEEYAIYSADNCGADWQDEALAQAKSELEEKFHSRQGLISSLKIDGFTEKEAEYAADSCGANWNEEAIKAAKKYFKDAVFFKSKESIIVKLVTLEWFTQEEATYGVNNCGLF